MKTKCESRILTVSQLTPEQKTEMFRFFAEYYVDVTLDRFLEDLSEKSHVLEFRDGAGLVGFSTLSLRSLPHLSRGRFLFSGDTGVRRDYWGSKILQAEFTRFIIRTKLSAPFRPLYWMLISKGFKTYLLMRRNFRKSYPDPNVKTPASYLALINGYYREKFGEAYDPVSGLIEFPQSHGAVRGHLADPTPEAMEDPEVRFFIGRNPRYREGVELACVAEIRISDFFKHALKYLVLPMIPKSVRWPARAKKHKPLRTPLGSAD